MTTSATNLLLLEGPDDIGVIYHLCQHYKIPSSRELEAGKVTLVNGKGVEQCLSSLKTRLKIQDDNRPVDRLGIIIDADMNVEARWQSLQTILKDAGYTQVPEAPIPDGTIIEEDDLITVGIWLMPNNQIPGKLEDFIRFLVKPDDELWPQARQCIAQIPEAARPFSDLDVIKAHVHTWLAWQEDPGKPMGLAITKKFLDANAPSAVQLTTWLQRLFATT